MDEEKKPKSYNYNDHNIVSKEEFNELKNTVHELKIALVGIDGENGFRGTLKSLDKRMGEMESDVRKISTFMETFKSKDLLYHETFSTKVELLSLKEVIISEITKLGREREVIRKEDRAREEDIKIESERLNLKRKDLLFVKAAIVISILSALASTGIALVNFFML